MKMIVCVMVVSLVWMAGCKSMECEKKPAAVEMPPAQAAETASEAAPEIEMAMQEVESSTIDKIGYDAESQALVITFDSGETYRYTEVPEKTYKGLMRAKSKGQYFHKNIKDKFAAEKMD